MEADACRQQEARRFHHSQSFGGMWFADGMFEPISGAVVDNALRRIEQELFEADWAEARERLGDAAGVSDLGRSAAQRRADALVEMARRPGRCPKGPGDRSRCSACWWGYETFAGRMCQLANGTVVTPGSLVPWLDQAWVERVVFDPASRVVDVGAARRAFTGATRRAVQLRDQQCFHPLCDEPAERCQVDHVGPWSAGGATVVTNGRAACAHHNRARTDDRSRSPARSIPPVDPRAAPAARRRGPVAWLWFAAGLVSVGLGGIGVLVPGLPTTVFFIVAAACFARSNPRFERWVLHLPRIGPLVRDHRAGLGMPRRAKALAVSMIVVAAGASALLAIDNGAVRASVIALGLVGVAYIVFRVPTRERVLAARGGSA
jgi:uncharacterized membrane protein YbaN (DUF454 family)